MIGMTNKQIEDDFKKIVEQREKTDKTLDRIQATLDGEDDWFLMKMPRKKKVVLCKILQEEDAHV